MTTNAKPRNPRTPAEWQEAADGAQVMLLVDAARQYGLIEGGPEVNQERCVEILQLAKRRGIAKAEEVVLRSRGRQRQRHLLRLRALMRIWWKIQREQFPRFVDAARRQCVSR